MRDVVGEEEEETITTTSPKTTNKTMDIDASKLFFRGVKGYNPIGTGPSKAQLLSPSRKFPSGSLPNLQSKSSTQDGYEKADAKKGMPYFIFMWELSKTKCEPVFEGGVNVSCSLKIFSTLFRK